MKNRWQAIRISMLICVISGWWVIWYPQLATIADTYAIVKEDGSVQKASEMIEFEADGYSYWDLMELDDSQIRVRSKLVDWFKEHYGEECLE